MSINGDEISLERQASEIISAMTAKSNEPPIEKIGDLLLIMARELDDLRARRRDTADACQATMGG